MSIIQSYSSSQVVFKLRISGVIRGDTLEKVTRDLSKKSFLKPSALAVVVNSPGGSAAHSSLIYNRLVYFAKAHKIPILTFAEDVAASGGYYIMCAGEKLYASSPLSLIGSIGARSTFIGIKGLLGKYGIERRSWASSEYDIHKRLDPLAELSEESKQWMQNMLSETGAEFQRIVVDNRKDKLTIPADKIN